jgi:predicted RNase H-like HicB family nuclease
MKYPVEFEREADGRWIAEIPKMPGVMVYGDTRKEAHVRVLSLAAEVSQSQQLGSGKPAKI